MERRRRSGFTLLEVMISVVILGLIVLNLSMVMKASTAAYGSGVFQSALEDQLDLTMDRMSLAMMSASAQKVQPQAGAPLGSDSIAYQTNLGVEDGAIVYGAPERIELVAGMAEAPGQVVWRENPGQPGERKAVWSSWVPPLAGPSPKQNGPPETPNEIDDNGNGLVDEPGLAFDPQGPKVHIHLTLQRKDAQGREYTKSASTFVTCRN